MKFVPLTDLKVGSTYQRVMVRINFIEGGVWYQLLEELCFVTRIGKEYIDFKGAPNLTPYDYVDSYGKGWGLRNIV